MEYKEEQLVFLENNKNNESVVTTDSGLQYEIMRKGTGNKPSLNNVINVDYKGTLINGTVFDSSYSRGESISFPLNGVIKGWQEGLSLMEEGAMYKFYIPFDLAYGDMDMSTIPAYSTLIFEVELHKIES